MALLIQFDSGIQLLVLEFHRSVICKQLPVNICMHVCMYVCMYVAAFKLLIGRMNRQWQWLEDGMLKMFVYFNITLAISRHDTHRKGQSSNLKLITQQSKSTCPLTFHSQQFPRQQCFNSFIHHTWLAVFLAVGSRRKL